jgi:hypothetical protein
MLALLRRVLESIAEDKLLNSVTVVDKNRIRRTSLPID